MMSTNAILEKALVLGFTQNPNAAQTFYYHDDLTDFVPGIHCVDDPWEFNDQPGSRHLPMCLAMATATHVHSDYDHDTTVDMDPLRSVYRFDLNGETVYIEFFGHWRSHIGMDYESFKVVQPVEKTITTYVRN